MKKRCNSVSVWVTHSLVTLSLSLSIWALIIANADNSGLVFNSDKIMDFAGLLFTVFGVVISLFFIIIGIDASRKKDKIKELDDEITEKQSQIEHFRKVESDQQDIMYGHLIAQAQNIPIENERKRNIQSLRLSRARLASQSAFLPKERRIQRMPDLSELGDWTDVEDINKIINDPYEDKDIVELAKITRDELLKRLKTQ